MPKGFRNSLTPFLPSDTTTYPEDRAHQDEKNRAEMLSNKAVVRRPRNA